jgi:hypothetical protein
LAREAVRAGIVEAIDPATVRRILDAVDLQPHRTRYGRTARLDDQFKDRAEKVLWCYVNAERLAGRGVYVVCADEMPNLQVPLLGWRAVKVIDRRTAVDFAEFVAWLVEEVHEEAEKVVLVMDNLNRHTLASLL